ncbi:RDD family protein [Rosistilla carotiformis]|uniref:RDD family protein n=1 Tax=Rosistilla carotiformis TaxID=2528017 RepID=A0A518JYG2_9BACT|nr:RDD family protein [Rosistilla carotiformis]QDV70575.1 RDD family protein [Rosistilla carotiformis]
MSDNPYASPVATPLDVTVSDEGGSIDGMPFASQNRRLVNFLVDNVMTQIVSSLAGGALGAAYAQSNGGQITQDQATTLQLMGMGLGLLVVLLYFFLMEATMGATVGKLLTSTRVVDAGGGKASVGKLIGRTFARLIPFEPVSFLFGDKTTGWHDSLSGTRVVDIRAGRR